MTGTVLFTHPACLDHQTGRGHPECPDRLRVILQSLQEHSFSALMRVEAPLATEQHLLLAHTPHHLETVKRHRPDQGLTALDPDTILSPGSWEAALRAAGAVIAAIDWVLDGRAKNAFCAIRPPGHHAEDDGAMGFCLFNNIAIGALHARQTYGLKRVAAIDFDVHHGNGTQAIFENDPDLFYGSTHQWGAYPGSGAASERGVASNVVNLPLRAGTGSEAWRSAVTGTLLPRLEEFAPELILISAGFDAHRADPLAQLRLETADFAWVTGEICALARRLCQGRIVSALEGGYDLPALAASAAAHVKALMEAAV